MHRISELILVRKRLVSELQFSREKTEINCLIAAIDNMIDLLTERSVSESIYKVFWAIVNLPTSTTKSN